ncbi:hypothetical protein VDG1235_2169 [Verrucomicrobiia bacterium DG1235]|nr:hypothetical protein VDG1235_2169 [Verrucomicrobiae bacterium DG1235]
MADFNRERLRGQDRLGRAGFFLLGAPRRSQDLRFALR